jgi:hypothetical protein
MFTDISDSIKHKIDSKLCNYRFMNCKSKDVSYGLDFDLKSMVQQALEPYNVSKKDVSFHSIPQSGVSESVTRFAHVRFASPATPLRNTDVSRIDGFPKPYPQSVNTNSQVAESIVITNIPLAILENQNVLRVRYHDGYIDCYLRESDGSPGRLIHPHEWEQFCIKDNFVIASQRSLANGRCELCRKLFLECGIVCSWDGPWPNELTLNRVDTNSRQKRDVVHVLMNSLKKPLNAAPEKPTSSVTSCVKNVLYNTTEPLKHSPSLDQIHTTVDWPGYYWIEQLLINDDTPRFRKPIERARKWKIMIQQSLNLNDDEFCGYIEQLKSQGYQNSKTKLISDEKTSALCELQSPVTVDEETYSFTFIDKVDVVKGYDLTEWMGYDLGTMFVPSEGNKYIGHIDRSGNWIHPDGIQENDIMSLHDGEYTRIRKVEKDMTMHKSNDSLSYGWWFISDDVDTNKDGWEYNNAIALGYTGCYIKHEN